MPDPIRIVIQYDSTGRPVIGQAVRDLESLSAAAKAYAQTSFQGGAALRQFEKDVNSVSNALVSKLGRSFSVVYSSAMGVSRMLETIARTGFYAFVGGVSAAVYSLSSLGKAFIKVNEDFAGLEITLRSSFQSVTIARQLREEIAKITVQSPIPFAQLADMVRVFSVLPQTRGNLALQATQGTLGDKNGFLQQARRLVEEMVAFRPDKTEEDAIFSIREALSGQFRSLVRRFDIPLHYLSSQAGKTSQELSVDPKATFDAMSKLFGSIITPQAIKEYSQQPRIFFQNLKEQIFSLPSLAIGDAGFYQKFLDKLTDLFSQVSDFITNKFKPYAKEISDSLSSVLDTISGIAGKGLDSILSKFGLGASQRPDLSVYERLTVGITQAFKSVSANLPDIAKRAGQFFDSLLSVIGPFTKAILFLVTFFAEHPLVSLFGLSQLRTLPSLVSATLFTPLKVALVSLVQTTVANALSGMATNVNSSGAVRGAAAGAARMFNLGSTQTVNAIPNTYRNLMGYIGAVNPITGSYQLGTSMSMLSAEEKALLATHLSVNPNSTGKPFLSPTLVQSVQRGAQEEEQALLAARSSNVNPGGASLKTAVGGVISGAAQFAAIVGVAAAVTYGLEKLSDALDTAAERANKFLLSQIPDTVGENTRHRTLMQFQENLQAAQDTLKPGQSLPSVSLPFYKTTQAEEVYDTGNAETGHQLELQKFATPEEAIKQMDKLYEDIYGLRKLLDGQVKSIKLATQDGKEITAGMVGGVFGDPDLYQATLRDLELSFTRDSKIFDNWFTSLRTKGVVFSDRFNQIVKKASTETDLSELGKLEARGSKLLSPSNLVADYFKGNLDKFSTIGTLQSTTTATSEQVIKYHEMIKEEFDPTYTFGKAINEMAQAVDKNKKVLEDSQLIESSENFSAKVKESIDSADTAFKNLIDDFRTAAEKNKITQVSYGDTKMPLNDYIAMLQKTRSELGSLPEKMQKDLADKVVLMNQEIVSTGIGSFIGNLQFSLIPELEKEGPEQGKKTVDEFVKRYVALFSRAQEFFPGALPTPDELSAKLQAIIPKEEEPGFSTEKEKVRVLQARASLWEFLTSPIKSFTEMFQGTSKGLSLGEQTPSLDLLRGRSNSLAGQANTLETLRRQKEDQAFYTQQFKEVRPNLLNLEPNEFGTNQYNLLLESVTKLGDPELASRLSELKGTILLRSDEQDFLKNYVDKVTTLTPLLQEWAKQEQAIADAQKLKGDDVGAKQAQQEAQKLLQLIDQANQKVRDIKGDGMFNSFSEGFSGVTDKWNLQMTNFKDIGTSTANSISSSFGEAFGSIIDNSKSAGKAFQDMGLSMLKTLASLFAKKAAESLIGAVFSSFGTSSATSLAIAGTAGNLSEYAGGFSAGGDLKSLSTSSSPTSTAKTLPSALSARNSATSGGDAFTFNIAITDSSSSNGPSANQTKGIDVDSMAKAIRVVVITEIQRQKRAGGELGQKR